MQEGTLQSGSPGPSQTAVLVGQSIAVGAMLAGVVLVVYALRRWLGKPLLPLPKQTNESAQSIATDMNELTDRLAADLDARAADLQVLIAAADQRIEALRALSAGAEVKPAPRQAAASSPEDSSHRPVYDLADAGLSTVEIAKRLDRPTGQVELILNLRRAEVRA